MKYHAAKWRYADHLPVNMIKKCGTSKKFVVSRKMIWGWSSFMEIKPDPHGNKGEQKNNIYIYIFSTYMYIYNYTYTPYISIHTYIQLHTHRGRDDCI